MNTSPSGNEHITLLPQPRRINRLAGTHDLTGKIHIQAPATCMQEAQLLQDSLRRAGLEATISAASNLASIILSLNDDIAHEQGYSLTIDKESLQIQARTQSGLYYGVMTLCQIIQQYGRNLPALHIEDWPDFAARGIMLDISRDRIPTMPELSKLVEQLASWKINQLQLYMEHSFAYSQHRAVWELASPMTGEEILLLDAHCKRHHIELVPNQNSLGHMERWLKHPQYLHLAEKPEGFDTDWADYMPPTTLDPADPGSLELIRSLYDELLPHFSSKQFNVGCDEPWELGKGKNAAAYAERGGRVYLDWILKLYEEVSQRGHHMQFWGDIILHHPELVPELPQDCSVMNWGYEANYDFDRSNSIFASSGIPFYVCPGTSGWNSISGRTDNAMANIRNAASSGLQHGATGFLNTDWGDLGHWQPPSVSTLGFAYGAAVSWGLERNADIDIRQALNVLVFEDQANILADIVYDLGNIYQMIGPAHINGQVLARSLQSSQADLPKWLGRLAKWGGAEPDIRPENLHSILEHLSTLKQSLSQTRIQHPDAGRLKAEFSHVANLLQHGADWLLIYQDAPRHDNYTLAQDWERLIFQQRQLWLARSRPGGLEDSMRRFETLRQHYASLL